MSNSVFKTFKAHTPGIRKTRLLSRNILLKNKPALKNLRSGYLFGNGRNNKGKITSWHKGGGHKRLYRHVDFFRRQNSQNYGFVSHHEYDPNRKPWIIRLFNPDHHKHSYVLGVKSCKRGDLLHNYGEKKMKFGSHLYLKDLPYGFVIHNLSDHIHKKGQYLRAAGTYGQCLSKTENNARIKLRSGRHRLFPLNASASLGPVINEELKFTKIGKAGRNRWHGIRPHVRGVAINPVDHPHGGGEGRTSGGRPSVTPWGKPTKGQPTVRNSRAYKSQYQKINK